MKISVVIPTLWASRQIEELLNNLYRIEIIEEIIVFDNNFINRTVDFNKFANLAPSSIFLKDSYNRPLKIDVHGKITVITAEDNLYVSEPWNIGTAISKADIVCLLNDDTIPEKVVFDNVVEFIQNNIETIGIVGINNNCYYRTHTSKDFLHVTTRPLAFGCCMFFLRSKYVSIPNDIKVWFNDDFLFYKGIKGDHYSYVGAKVTGTLSATNNNPQYRSRLSKVIVSDEIAYKKI